MDAYVISGAAGLIGAAAIFFIVQRLLVKERGRGFFAGDHVWMSLFMIALLCGFFVLFASLSIFLLKRDSLALMCGLAASLPAIFVSLAMIGKSLPKYAGAAARALVGFAGLFYLAMAATYIFIGAALPSSGAVPGDQLVSAKDDYWFFASIVVATVAMGISYIYDAVKKKQS